MTQDEKIVKLADGLNQVCLILDTVAWEIQKKYRVDLRELRKDLTDIRVELVELIPE